MNFKRCPTILLAILTFFFGTAFSPPVDGFETESGHYWGKTAIGNGEYYSENPDIEGFTFQSIDTKSKLGERDTFNLKQEDNLVVYSMYDYSSYVIPRFNTLRIMIDTKSMRGWVVYNKSTRSYLDRFVVTVHIVREIPNEEISELLPALEVAYESSLKEKIYTGFDGWHVEIIQVLNHTSRRLYAFSPMEDRLPAICRLIKKLSSLVSMNNTYASQDEEVENK